jgi:hypothetical protein
MPCVGFEPTIPMFKQAKTFHALDRAATVIGLYEYSKDRGLFYGKVGISNYTASGYIMNWRGSGRSFS